MKLWLPLLLAASTAQAQTTRALIITGVTGDPEITQQLRHDEAALRDAIVKRFGGTAVVLNETTTPRSDRAAIQQAITQLAQQANAADHILIVLLGHGSASGDDVRFNIPGPDLTAADLASWLAALHGDVAVVIATSASGAFLNPLSAPGRLVVTATRSASENEAVTFPRHFARALAEDIADTDHDGGVSIREAFEYARREVARGYQQENRLATEHAQVSDSVRAGAFVIRAPGSAPVRVAVRPPGATAVEPETKSAAVKPRTPATSAAAASVRARLTALDDMVAADPNNMSARIQIGRLFLEKYNAPEALKSFAEVLQRDPKNADALLGRAEALEFLNEPGVMQSARAALAANPDHVATHAFLTRLFVDSDNLDSARVHAAATRTAPASLEARIANAQIAQVESNRNEIDRIRATISEKRDLARYDVALAELSVKQRHYAEAVTLASRAIASDSQAWSAYAVRGINELRLGNPAAARKTLEKAFEGDPYNVWVKNTLDLLDRLDEFKKLGDARFAVVAAPRDADVLAPYIVQLGAEAFAKLKRRYGYEPPTPVRVELFDRHADFSVRTVGLTGLGALGVSFGSVLALDAPSARDPRTFSWGSTFWHELAHAFHLGMTEGRVPRWFTEGLAVLEERHARSGWGEEGLPAFEEAAQTGKLLPLAQLNAGFSRPTYPAQVIVSYYQASLVLEMIEKRYGTNALRGMLEAYRAGKSTDAAFQSVVHATTEELDKQFATYMEEWRTDLPRRKAEVAAAEYEPSVRSGTIEALENAVYTFPYDPAVHNRLAELYATARDWPNVIRERRVIIALQPVDIAEARYQLALAYHSAGDNVNARKEVLRALETAPSFAKAQDLLVKLGARQ